MKELLIIISRINATKCDQSDGGDEYVADFGFKGEMHPESNNVGNILFMHGCYFYKETEGGINVESTVRAIKEKIDSLRLDQSIYLLFHQTQEEERMRKSLMENLGLDDFKIARYSSTPAGNNNFKKVKEMSLAIRNGEDIDIGETLKYFFPNNLVDSLIHLHKTLSLSTMMKEKPDLSRLRIFKAYKLAIDEWYREKEKEKRDILQWTVDFMISPKV